MNFDGAFNSTSHAGGWGYAIRDQLGDYVAAGAGKAVHLKDALQSEVVACLAGVDGAMKMGLNRVIF